MTAYSNAQVRNLLTTVFENEEDFEFFVEDHFEAVVAQFEADMSLKRKAQELAKYCQSNNLTNQLVSLISQDFPDKFKESGLPGPEPETVAAPAPTPVESVAAPKAASASPAPAASTAASEPPDAPQNPDVFISYSRKDETFIKQLYNELIGRGISSWYDRKNIRVGQHWPSEIVEGIENCRIFLLSVSPDSTASVNVRKEVDLAQRYQKQIVPLIWRRTQIPKGMEYQLAGIQWIEFNEDAAPDKFNQLAEVLQALMGGSSLPEVSSGQAIVTESPLPAIEPKEPAPGGRKVGGGRRLGGLRGKTKVNPLALGGLVIAGVVTTFGLDDTADEADVISEQDFVNNELDWLFRATDHLLKLRSGEIDPGQPISVAIPPEAKVSAQANNKILNASFPSVFAGKIEELFDRIKKRLDNLDLVLKREAQLGQAALTDLGLQADLKGNRLSIVQELVTLANMMEQAYGVLVTSPGQLVELLEQ